MPNQKGYDYRLLTVEEGSIPCVMKDRNAAGRPASASAENRVGSLLINPDMIEIAGCPKKE